MLDYVHKYCFSSNIQQYLHVRVLVFILIVYEFTKLRVLAIYTLSMSCGPPHDTMFSGHCGTSFPHHTSPRLNVTTLPFLPASKPLHDCITTHPRQCVITYLRIHATSSLHHHMSKLLHHHFI